MNEMPLGLAELEKFKCELCGCTGLHACIGQPTKPWTEEDSIALKAAITEMLKDE